jgi:predicted nucleic acid-binding protein
LSFVLDASVTLAWFLPDEGTPYAMRIRDRLDDQMPIVPWLWRVEVVNGLMMAERRNRIAATDVDLAVDVIDCLAVRIDDTAPLHVLRDLARRHQRTIYDAIYLNLAFQSDLPLATLDGGLRQACREAGVALIDA